MDNQILQDFINNHGNNFHVKVVNFLRSCGWKVLVSPYFIDNFTDKSREVDIIAEKDFIYSNFYLDKNRIIKIRLFKECKFINDEIIFWFDKKDLESAMKMVSRDTLIIPPVKENDTIKKHHYCENTDVAKIFATKKGRDLENEIIYKAINQSLNSLIYYKPRLEKLTEKESAYVLDYPIIICNSFNRLYKTSFEEPEKVDLITTNFQLETNYAYMSSTGTDTLEYFLLDIVSFDNLGYFLKMIEEKDVAIMKIFIDD